MGFLERWDAEAEARNRKVNVVLIVDRGFHDFQTWIGAHKWSALSITVEKPSFLNPIKRRGEHYTDEERKQKRKRFDSEEAERNREIAGERWVNEWAVGALKNSRLFKRRLDLSILPLINFFLRIAAARVNYNLKMKQNQP